MILLQETKKSIADGKKHVPFHCNDKALDIVQDNAKKINDNVTVSDNKTKRLAKKINNFSNNDAKKENLNEKIKNYSAVED